MNYDIDAIDNNSKQLADYANRFADSENFTVKTEQSDAFSKGISQKNADLILLSHSLYHAHPSQLKEIIPNVYNSMNDKGIAVISLLKDDSDFSKIQEEFGKYVTSNQETNPVSVKLEDIVGTINDDPNLAEHSQRQPYDAYVYFPKVPGGFEEFKQWQLNEPQKEAPNSECKLTLDLLEFIVHGEMGKLRKSEQLKPFLDTIENMFEKNGPDDEGHNRINFNGENIFLLGADNPLNKK